MSHLTNQTRSKIKFFFSAIVDEWKQNWQVLLILFAVNMYCLVLNRNFTFFWYDNRGIFFFILALSSCLIPVVMVPNLCKESRLSQKPAVKQKNKLMKILAPLWRILLLLLIITVWYILRLDMDKCPKWWSNGPLYLFQPVFFFALIILFCIIFFAFRLKKPVCYRSKIFYWIKFIAGWLQFMLFTMLNFAIYNTSSCDFIYYSFNLLPLIIASGVYALVFFSSIIMPKASRLIVFIVAIPLGFLLFFLFTPGIIAVVALFGTDSFLANITMVEYNFCHSIFFDIYVALSYISIIPLLVFIIIMPIAGYYLWTKKILVRKKYFSFLLMTTASLMVVSFILNILAEHIVQSRLLQATQEAQSLRLIYKPEHILQDSPSIPSKHNVARLYRQAFKIFKKLDREEIFYSPPSGIFGDSLNYMSIVSPENKGQLLTLSKSPEWEQTNILIEKASSFSECSFVPQITKYRINLFAHEAGYLGYFILAQADIYRLTGQNDKILPEIEKCILLAKRINNEQLESSFTTSKHLVEYSIINSIKIGPENPTSADAYRRMLDYLNRNPINYLYNPLEFPRTLQAKEVQWADLFIGHTLFLQIWTDYANNSIKVRRKMLKISKMPVLSPKLKKQLKNDSTSTYISFLNLNLIRLFRARSIQTMLKIGLALKIYKCEHEKYPNTLQKLTPAILPAIPLDSLSGKAFSYKFKKDNFILSKKTYFNHTLSSELLFPN